MKIIIHLVGPDRLDDVLGYHGYSPEQIAASGIENVANKIAHGQRNGIVCSNVGRVIGRFEVECDGIGGDAKAARLGKT